MKARALFLIAILVFATQFAWGAFACVCPQLPRPAVPKAKSCPMSGQVNCHCCSDTSNSGPTFTKKSECKVEVAVKANDAFAFAQVAELSIDLPLPVWSIPLPLDLEREPRAVEPIPHRARPPDLASRLLRAPPFA